MPLSVTIITKNESANLARALESVRWADEVVVVDSESTDDTVSIAKRFTKHVYVRRWSGYIEQKNYAASMATHDWILSLDADERVTPELAAEIQSILSSPSASVHAFRIPRVTFHLGRWIRGTDWYPDRQTRLYDRRKARWTGRYVHERLTVAGALGEMKGELEHYPYADVAAHLDTINRYTSLAARQMHEDGRRTGVAELLGHPPLAFLRNYVAKAGYREGRAGLIISALNAYYVFLKFAKLWELQRSAPADPHTGDAARSAARSPQSETRGPQSEAGNPKPEARSPQPEARSLKPE